MQEGFLRSCGMDIRKVKNPELPWTLFTALSIGSAYAQQHRPSALCSDDVHYIAHLEVDLTEWYCQAPTKP